MSSLRGFRCRQCWAEVLVAADLAGRTDGTPSILCCGEPLRPVASDQIPSEIRVGVPACGRVARCPRCGYRIRVVVHPSGPLVCRSCRTALTIGTGAAGPSNGFGSPAAKMAPGSFKNV